MALIHAHQISMRNMSRLVQWRMEQGRGGQGAARAAVTAAPAR
jgi:hypothetical protein